MSLLALLDVFRRHREKATGVWKLGQEPCRTIFFDSGDIVFAQSTHPLDKLTHLLVERGKLTQAQLDYAMANLKPGLSIGKNLIDMGFITQRDLLDVARAQVERIVWGALGTAGESPAFAGKDLEPSVVRLPMDTPLLLLNAILNFQDRERLLELLGPLNQVVVLQTRRLVEMDLPADLAKLSPCLDGTHTLRELSQQGYAEPLRLGAFVLFLREMGWARLHEMPPLDRQALDRALEPEPERLSPPLPEAPVETVPSLFSTIEAAARPTTNLEHLSLALDGAELPETLPEPSPAPDPYAFQVQTGQAMIPTPSVELPLLPDEPEPEPESAGEPEPELRIRPATVTPLDGPVLDPVPEFQEIKPRRGLAMPLLLLLLIAAGLGAAYWWKVHRASAARSPVAPQATPRTEVKPPAPETAQVQAPDAPQPPAEEPKAQPEQPKPQPEGPKPQVAEAQPRETRETKAKGGPVSHTLESRLQALRKPDLELALRQGRAHAKELNGHRWVLRLEIASQGDTVKHALELFPEAKPDLFLLPITLKDGRSCYQVLYGDFPSQAAAEKHIRRLPAAFRAAGNRPRPFRVSEIPSKQ